MRSPIITVMSNAAISAGKGLLRDFGEVDQLQVSRKGVADFVTASDIRTEKKLVSELKRARPDFGFLLEEQGQLPGKDPEYRWIIDPLDGTSNFIHAVPYFCISIALERGGRTPEITAGIVYDPIHNELFYAEKGKGAFLNDRRLSASGRDALEDAMVVTSNPRAAFTEPAAQETLRQMFLSAGFVRATGASALDLAYVGAGRYDACWFKGLKPWDAAAGLLIVQEARGIVSDHAGGPASIYGATLLASNPHLHGKMMKLLAGSPSNR